MPALSELYPGEMLPVKAIPLTQGQTMIVDPGDAWIAGMQWYAQWDLHAQTFYARASRDYPEEDIRKFDVAHVVIMQEYGIDHVNHNGLDNKRVNLRVASASQNNANSRVRRDNTSSFKGVSWYRRDHRWVSHISIDGHRITLGYFNNTEDAARAYDHAAVRHFGEFAYTNSMAGLVDHAVCDPSCPSRKGDNGA